MANTMEDTKQNKVENMHDTETILSVDETEGGMTKDAFADKREAVAFVEKQLSEMGVATEHSLPVEKKGIFAKLKESFRNIGKVSPEKMVAKMQQELADDMREIGISKDFGQGSGGFSGKSNFEKLLVKYAVSEAMQDEYKKACEDLNAIPQVFENNDKRKTAQAKINTIKGKVKKEMQATTEAKIAEMQKSRVQ
jgi:hypothetical protein